MENEKARKKEERLKAIPNPPAMTKATDLIEYLALFETTQTRSRRVVHTPLAPPERQTQGGGNELVTG